MTDRRPTFSEFLRAESTGGVLLLFATAAALVWANVAADSYGAFWGFHLGPAGLGLDLSLSHWATDGLLAIFFVVAGIEVKRELVVGELSRLRDASLPVCAALGGLAVPPLVALVVSRGAAASDGIWAVPLATDIAFALGVLALVATSVPASVRVFLLSLAVLDDLVAITVIAVVFTDSLRLIWLLPAVVGAMAWWLLLRRAWPTRSWARGFWVATLVVIGVCVWVAVHASGVHATVAGVVLGLLVPVRGSGEGPTPAERLQHALHPLSAGVCVPVFALAAAGISLSGIADVPGEPLAVAVALGLLLGKPLGILLGTFVAVRCGLSQLPAAVSWRHIGAIGMLGGIGYTVSLLIVQIAAPSAGLRDALSAAVLGASCVAAVGGIALLRGQRVGST